MFLKGGPGPLSEAASERPLTEREINEKHSALCVPLMVDAAIFCDHLAARGATAEQAGRSDPNADPLTGPDHDPHPDYGAGGAGASLSVQAQRGRGHRRRPRLLPPERAAREHARWWEAIRASLRSRLKACGRLGSSPRHRRGQETRRSSAAFHRHSSAAFHRQAC